MRWLESPLFIATPWRRVTQMWTTRPMLPGSLLLLLLVLLWATLPILTMALALLRGMCREALCILWDPLLKTVCSRCLLGASLALFPGAIPLIRTLLVLILVLTWTTLCLLRPVMVLLLMPGRLWATLLVFSPALWVLTLHLLTRTEERALLRMRCRETTIVLLQPQLP